ncbi:MAG: site-specific integrase [Rhizobiales bacterium]|nr:site-specific integrase [Hyphomicrobiales bacterium]
MGDKVQIYKRPNTPFWQCSTFLHGKKRRASTKEVSLSLAKEFAEDWYLVLRGKHHRGELKNEKLFSFAAKQFTKEYDVITQGQRSLKWVKGHHDRLRLHLLPFFGELGLSEVSAGKVQDYRISRMESAKGGKPPARSTLHDETVTLRQVLKTAMRHGWLKHLPDLSSPYNSQTKISHRAWFTAKEYKQLYEATRRRANKPKNPCFKWNAEQLHDYVLFMANTGLRPDEAKLLQFRDVEIVHDESTDEIILEIEVRGKRGVGFCKSMNGAVRPFERLLERLRLVVALSQKFLKVIFL